MLVDTINAIFRENCAQVCTSVVFESQKKFTRTLESFLSAECRLGKVVVGDNGGAMETLMVKFVQLAMSLSCMMEGAQRQVKTPRL